jgi:cell fate (sporulation/competence/biofilm development) regulator YmcA (YheA/YmcA/DUF963 family)
MLTGLYYRIKTLPVLQDYKHYTTDSLSMVKYFIKMI